MAIEFQPVDDDPEAGDRAAALDRLDQWDAEVCTNLMSTPQGRYLIERFLDFCCEDAELYRDDGDALGMAKRDGLAKAGRWWRVMLEKHCADRLLQMIRERRSRMARARAAVAEREAARQAPPAPEELSPIEALADEQKRQADAELAAAAKKTKPKKER